MPWLDLVVKKTRRAVALDQTFVVFGRTTACDINLENVKDISREHAGFRRYEDEQFTVVDFGSRNGTYINDEQIFAETRLEEGDKVRLGRFVQMTFHRTPAPENTDKASYEQLGLEADTEFAPFQAAGKVGGGRSSNPRDDPDQIAKELAERGLGAMMQELTQLLKPEAVAKSKASATDTPDTPGTPGTPGRTDSPGTTETTEKDQDSG